jgi:hypothetical protein
MRTVKKRTHWRTTHSRRRIHWKMRTHWRKTVKKNLRSY